MTRSNSIGAEYLNEKASLSVPILTSFRFLATKYGGTPRTSGRRPKQGAFFPNCCLTFLRLRAAVRTAATVCSHSDNWLNGMGRLSHFACCGEFDKLSRYVWRIKLLSRRSEYFVNLGTINRHCRFQRHDSTYELWTARVLPLALQHQGSHQVRHPFGSNFLPELSFQQNFYLSVPIEYHS